ncbi:DUF3153 domain-containing protein [Cohnella nanjingensis]|uniref:DUF3153 domain-containing protein n=1 Tax=Cohnella nanjingensis TaxID=1387779 RepID=A0A7X0RTN0_9BACL|nr:DUF3153 domain-containing protein [Cohnella nanjingensis]MBB6673497.1 DUF3153 domain-containing protein [Cohnella nanjingensis]
MVRNRSIKRHAPFLAGAWLLMTMLLTSCAQGQAHLTVHLNGTADLELNASARKKMLKLIGQSDLPRQLADELQNNGLDASVEETENSSGIRASRHLNLKELQNRPSRLPEGVKMTLTEDKKFFYTRYHIIVDADPNQALSKLEGDTGRQLATMPALAKQLAQSQIHFDLLLTSPIPLRDHNADETRDGGRTLVWHVSLVDVNHFELSFPVPQVRHIAYVGVPAILLLGFIVVGTVFFMRKRRRHA